MVIDTSAIVAILLKEPDRLIFEEKILNAVSRHISAISYMESAMVLISNYGQGAEEALDQMLEEAQMQIESVSVVQAKLAISAFRQYGKGRHPAGLNFGDCFSYALAKSSGEPLLFKGFDFDKTDIKRA